MLPRIHDEKALYGSLASSHLNIALRLILQGVSSPAGDLSTLLDQNKTLSDTVQHGHKWWIIKETTPLEDQVAISLWRNQDQNENHGFHEVELLQNIMSSAEHMRRLSQSSAGSDKVSVVGTVEVNVVDSVLEWDGDLGPHF